jgi:hypothetical protein
MNNGARHSGEVHKKARDLRSSGLTHREISHELGVSVGMAHIWTKGIRVTKKQKDAIEKRRMQAFRAKFADYTKTHREEMKKRIEKNLGPYQYKQKYTSDALLQDIRDFYTTYKRIPLKRERGNSRIYRIRFKTWNNAVRRAGFDPNPELFAHKYIAHDGHTCDSFSEKIIDDWLSARGMYHERNYSYKGTRMTADFFLRPNTVIEFFGLAGAQKKYDDLIVRKREIAKSLKLNLVEMYPKDLPLFERR